MWQSDSSEADAVIEYRLIGRYGSNDKSYRPALPMMVFFFSAKVFPRRAAGAEVLYDVLIYQILNLAIILRGADC